MITKAYDVKELVALARKKGGPGAEKVLKANWEAIKEWLRTSASLTPTPYDDMAMAGLTIVDGPIMKALDQVDGVIEGQE